MLSDRRRSGLPVAALTAVLAAAASGCGDDFTPEEQASEPPCHPAELEDDFSGDQLSLLWNAYGEDGTVGVAQGRGFIELAANQAPQGAGMATEREYDLRGCNLWVAVPLVPAADGQGGAFLMAALDEDHYALFETWAGSLTMGLVVGGTFEAATSTTYDAANHRWWRLREESGTLYFEMSSDAAQWDTLLQTASPAEIDAVTVVLAAQIGEPYGAAARVEVDNLNLVP